jgi:orotate phosphoribosyltransferase
MIEGAGGVPCGVALALDRQEKATLPAAEGGGDAPWSAVQFVQQRLGLQVCAIATLGHLLQYLQSTKDPALREHFAHVDAYRDRYGV